jgi:hypothetical protein
VTLPLEPPVRALSSGVQWRAARRRVRSGGEHRGPLAGWAVEMRLHHLPDNPAATTASNALPPSSNTAIPAAEANQCVQATMDRPNRSNRHTTSVSPARRYPRHTASSGRSVSLPAAVSLKLLHPTDEWPKDS